MVDHFVEVYSKKYRKNIKNITEEALKKLQLYNWPGNVRELQHAIERAVIMSEKDEIDLNDFFFLSTTSAKDNQVDSNSGLNLDDVERNMIKKAIDLYEGNISKAAKELGLTRASLYRRLEKHGL